MNFAFLQYKTENSAYACSYRHTEPSYLYLKFGSLLMYHVFIIDVPEHVGLCD